MFCKTFWFNGHHSDDFGLYILSLDNFEEDNTIGSNIEFTTIKNSNSDVEKVVAAQYSESITTKIQVFKLENCHKMGEINPRELSNIMRWLNRKDGFHTFKLIEEDYDDLCFEAMINATKIKIGGYIYGLELTIATNKPYVCTDDITKTFTVAKNQPIVLLDDSDEVGYRYCHIQIKLLEAGNLSICNGIENRYTVINNCKQGEVIEMSGDTQIITSSLSSSTHSTLYDDFNYAYFRLANTYDNRVNKLTFSLACQITLTYNFIRKVGM
jgi:hypothetical protein